jgi:hypothetical protein
MNLFLDQDKYKLCRNLYYIKFNLNLTKLIIIYFDNN